MTKKTALKRDRARETRRSLVAAAEELFHWEGIRASGIGEIATRAGVTKMTLYAHFASKDDLIAAYLTRRDEQWRKRLEETLVKHDTPEQKLLAVFDAYREWLIHGGLRGCSFVNFSAEFPMEDHPGKVVVKQH